MWRAGPRVYRDESGERSSTSETAVEERAAAAALDSASNRKAELNAAAAELHRALYYDGTGVPDAA